MNASDRYRAFFFFGVAANPKASGPSYSSHQRYICMWNCVSLHIDRKGISKSNALTVQVDAEGKAKYDAIAQHGHSENRTIQAFFTNLMTLHQHANMGEISLDQLLELKVTVSMEKTKNALAALVSGAVAAQKPKKHSPWPLKGLKRTQPVDDLEDPTQHPEQPSYFGRPAITDQWM